MMVKAIRWTEEGLAEYNRRTKRLVGAKPPAAAPGPAKKASKYKSRKVEQDGVTYDSAKEARRAAELERMQAAGQITELRRQVAFVLAPAVRFPDEVRQKPPIRYFADFSYVQNGVTIIEDVKSAPTKKKESYRLKKHLLATVHGLFIKEI